MCLCEQSPGIAQESLAHDFVNPEIPIPSAHSSGPHIARLSYKIFWTIQQSLAPAYPKEMSLHPPSRPQLNQ